MYGLHLVYGVFYGNEHNKHSCIVNISFDMLKSEYYILILFQKSDVGYYKIKISKR